MPEGFTNQEIEHLMRGPFPERIDPWAEASRYFQSLHSGMIEYFLTTLQAPLFQKGYVIGKETSLQALHVRDANNGDLITVVEIISPGNKTRDGDMAAYRLRRERLLIDQQVNVMEIDLTRSVKRLLVDSLTRDYPYHVAIYLPGDAPRVVSFALEARLGRVAMPLKSDVVAMELHDAYRHAYERGSIAWHIQHEGRYSEAHLPFPTLLSGEQKKPHERRSGRGKKKTRARRRQSE